MAIRQRVLEMLGAANLPEVNSLEIEPHSERVRYEARRALRDIMPPLGDLPSQVYWLTEAVRVLWEALEEEKETHQSVCGAEEEFAEAARLETSPDKIREYELEVRYYRNLALEAEKAQALLYSDLERIKSLILTEVLGDSEAQMLCVEYRAIFAVNKQIRIFYPDGKVITL